MINRIVLIFSVYLLLLSYRGFGGEITLRMKATTQLNLNQLSVQIEITNLGNEPAYEVKPVFSVNNEKKELAIKKILHPQSTHVVNHTQKNKISKKAGTYLFPLYISYKDSFGASFKIPYIIKMNHVKELRSGLRWKIDPLTLPKEKKVRIRLKNLDSWTKKLRLSQVPAMDFNFQLPQSPIILEGHKNLNWEIPVEYNKLWPSNYINYLIVEFEHNNQHYSSSSPIRTKVTNDADTWPELFSRRTIIFILTGLIIFTVLGYLAEHKKRALVLFNSIQWIRRISEWKRYL